jgi:GDP-mannose 6-dehydrogenase
MKIIVWGLGCCGLVNAACFAAAGHEVIGVDYDESLIEALNSGECDIAEPGLRELLDATKNNTIFVASAGSDIMEDAEASLICVGTPGAYAAGLDTKHVEEAISTIARLIAENRRRFHGVFVRSTTNIGFLRGCAQPILEGSNPGALGIGYGLATLPEFLREGRGIEDFNSPSISIAGCVDQKSEELLNELYRSIDASVHFVAPDEAETLKLVNNSFHALKIGFANEIGRFCASHHVNSERIMELVCEDERLNISSAYLRPGAAFGGSCLPKDLLALVTLANARGLKLPLLEGVLPSNADLIELWVETIARQKGRRVGILGLSFKAGTDDLRNSPALALAKHLTQRGYRLAAYDPDIRGDRLHKRNCDLLQDAFGNVSRALMETTARVVQASDVVALLHRRPEFEHVKKLAISTNTAVLDFSDPEFMWLSSDCTK